MKWEELPLADRAKLMAVAVKNGYTDIRSIKEAYANYQNQKQSAGNRYAEGGGMYEPEVINALNGLPMKNIEKNVSQSNSGNLYWDGSLLDKEKIYNRVPGDSWQTSSVKDALQFYFTNPDDYVEKRLAPYERFKDLSYEDAMNAMEYVDTHRDELLSPYMDVANNYKDRYYQAEAPMILQHEDAKDVYLGLPQRNNIMKPAEYQPTQGHLDNGHYIPYMREPVFINDIIMPTYNEFKRKKMGLSPQEDWANGKFSQITKNGNAVVHDFPFLSEATISGGIDPQRGEYASIYDRWDYNTSIAKKSGDNVSKIIGGKPFDIYDRYYLDDYYGVDSKPWRTEEEPGYYGGYLPELVVTNKNAYGGNLFKTGGNKGKKRGITQQELQRRRDYYRQQLIIRGLRGAQLDAVLANMEVESTLDPGAHNDASGARGLMQWLGSRKPKSWSEKDQLDYIAATYNKLGGNEWLDKAAWKRFNETTDPAEAARLFRRYWERPEKSSWYATDKYFGKQSYLPQEVNDLVAQVSNLQYDEPKAPIFTEEDQRLLDTPALAFYNPEYEDTQAPDYKPSALQESIKLDESLWRDPANNWALYNQFANMQQGSSQDDPLSWMTMMASLSPKTTPEQKEAASTMYQLFAPQDGDYMYHGLNFAAYGGKVNRFDDGGFSDLPEQRAYRRAVNLKAPYTNYEDAIDMDDSIMLRLKKFFDKGVSNCTLTASQLFNPNNPIGRARTIVNDSINNGFYEIDADHVVPGTMVIASHPNMSDYSPEQNYHTMIVTGFAPNDYEYTFRDGTKYQIKKGEPLVSYSRGKASADNYVHDIPLSVYNANSEGKTYNRYYRPIDERYPQVMIDGIEVVANKKANGGHLFDNGGNLFYKGGLKDQFANTYLGIGQFPDYDSDFIVANNLQYLPYSQLNMTGHDPENIRIGNQGNQTMRVYDDKDATYLADANGNLVTSPLLRQMTQDYVKEHYGPMLQKAFLSNPDKYWDEYNRYRNSAITFDENGNPVSSGLPPIEKPIEPAAPEFWLLSAGASKVPSALNSVISPLFNMTAVDNMIDDVTPYSSWGNMMSQNAGGPEWAWDLVHPSFTGGLFTNAAKKALTAGADAASKATRNTLASSAINYGAKTRSLPTNIYKQRMLFNVGENGRHRYIHEYNPLADFIDTKRRIPSNTSYFFRSPNNVDILNVHNGSYGAKAQGNVIIGSGSVDGKFVSYGEPWMEFGVNPKLDAWYEFPTMKHRGPHRMATDWRGNRMDYTTQEAYDQMAIRRNPEFQKDYNEFIFKDFNSREEALQAQKDFNEKWGIDPSVNVYDIYHSNQTVIPNKEWNFNSEYPRGFLSQPFWRYTADPYSGAVQKELMMNWESPMKTLDKVHADIIPFLDETGKWDYLTDFANEP